MKKVIRLTESDLANMVKRIIREMDDDLDYESNYEKMTKEDVRAAIADFFSDKLENLSPREIRKMKSIVNDKMSGSSMEMGEDLDDRKRKRRQNLGIAGGLGMAGIGALSALSHGMGYTDAGELMVAIHDAVHSVGGNYSGITPGAGGVGRASSISGTSVTYAGGGGATDWAGVSAAGGTGGGGAGGATGVAGTANTGGGGGGSGFGSGGSGAGGSGIVIIRYPIG